MQPLPDFTPKKLFKLKPLFNYRREDDTPFRMFPFLKPVSFKKNLLTRHTLSIHKW